MAIIQEDKINLIVSNPVTKTNVTVLKNDITAAERAKLDGIEAGATADQSIQTGDGLSGGASSGDVTLTVDNTVVRTTGDQSIAGIKTFTGSLSINGAYNFPTTIGSTTQVLKVNSTQDGLEFGDAPVVAVLNDLNDVNVNYSSSGSDALYNALVYDGTSWVMYNPSQKSFPPNTTDTSFLGDDAPIDKSKIGFDNINSGLSINSDTSYASSGINFYVNGGARVDGAIQVNDPSSTGYAFPTTDGTANQLLATDGSGAVTFVTPSTSNVTEGTNLYYTDARVAANSAVAANTAKTSFPGFGTTAGTALEGDTALFDGQYSSLTGVPSTFAPSAHTHTASEITDFDTEVSNNASVASNTAKVGYTDAAVDARIAAASIDDLSDVDTSTVAPTDGQALVWDNANSKWEPGTVSGGGSSPWTTSGSDIYYTTGNVGIGTTTPAKVFHAAGDSKIDGTLLVKTQYNAVILGSGTAGGGNSAQADGNVIVGHNAMGSYTYGNGISYRNVAIGVSALNSGTGAYNVSIGRSSMSSNYTRSNTVGVGNLSFQQGGGSNGVAVGGSTGRYANGSFNTLVGSFAGQGASGTSTFSNTVAVGYQALTALTTGANNTAVGYQAGDSLSSGNYNSFFGYAAGGNASSSNGITAIGYNASNAGSSTEATLIGHFAGQTGGGLRSVAVGNKARQSQTGDYSIGIGSWAGNLASGQYDVSVGTSAGQYPSGGYNVLLGASAGTGVLGSSTFSNTVAVGYQAGTALTTGGSNILIGYQAGSTLTTESNKLYIENSNSTTPLIYGEFDNDLVRINGDFEVTGGVKIEKTSNTDYDYRGDVVYFGATTGMTQGDLYYFNSSGNWAQADANAVASSGSVLLAIALGTASDTDGMLLRGTFTMEATAIDGTEATGDELYVGTTAGHVTSDVSAYTTGDVVRIVGYCLDGTNGQIYFNPSSDWIELS